MYESFFGFVKRPFLAASTLDRYFPAACIEQTFQTTARAIQRGEGPVAIFGGTGLGKTMCCMRIAESFRRNFEVVMLSSSQLITRRALLQCLLFELRMPYRDLTEGELRLSLMSRLQPSTDNSAEGLVLVIDEAQTLSMKLLDEIRLLTNVVRNGIPRVRLVLCGTMRLEDCLSHPHMDSLNQRLAARCYLTPLSNQETGQYVIHKIELSGVEGSTVMTRDSLDAIYRGSDGIPRLIDQLADQSLLLACNDRERPVSAAMVGRAWRMLQQLPNPWSEPDSIVKSAAHSAPSLSLASSSQIPSSSSPAAKSQIPMVSNVSPEPISAPNSVSMLQNSAASLPQVASHSNIEFGQLDDDFPEEMEDSVEVTDASPVAKKNLLDVFAGEYDEEFLIPVQSSDSYQAYSGASYGNLNHDLSSFGVSHLNPNLENRLVFEESNDFFSNPLQTGVETISNISPEQAANLERQIEEEMRDLVSGLDMSAMAFDPATSVDPIAYDEAFAMNQAVEHSQVDYLRLSHQAHTDVITFSGMHNYSNDEDFEQVAERVAMGDDRDLLVIEDDLGSVRNGVAQANGGTHRAVLHPYAKLFTKLRKS